MTTQNNLFRFQNFPSEALSNEQKNQMSQWLMRQYFAERNKKDIWFSNQVDASNVLNYVANPSVNFPLTPKESTQFFKSMKSVQAALNVKEVSRELNELYEKEVKATPGKHFCGVSTLDTIASELGGITMTMVNKIENIALAKYLGLFNNQHPDTLSSEELEAIQDRIVDAQEKAAKEYTSLLKQKSSLKEFLKDLKSGEYIPEREIISDQEQYALMLIFDKEEELIEEMLVCDIQSENNVFKTFQYFVSYALHQRRKRGRPSKASLEKQQQG